MTFVLRMISIVMVLGCLFSIAAGIEVNRLLGWTSFFSCVLVGVSAGTAAEILGYLQETNRVLRKMGAMLEERLPALPPEPADGRATNKARIEPKL